MPTIRITDLQTLDIKLLGCTATESRQLHKYAVRLANAYCYHLGTPRAVAMRQAWQYIKRTCTLRYTTKQ